ncbi:uncharacterized protein LOC141622478 [Silene latifolia]|uniref:uncharacterized protein LOC141622478 n=1 Tax=Silene latifolia TaxID=37657 RepID=UPI003D7857C3
MASKVVGVAAIVCAIVSIVIATSSIYNLESSFKSLLPLYAPFFNNSPKGLYVTSFAIVYLIERKKYKRIGFYFFVLEHLALMALMVYRTIPSGGSAGIQGQ